MLPASTARSLQLALCALYLVNGLVLSTELSMAASSKGSSLREDLPYRIGVMAVFVKNNTQPSDVLVFRRMGSSSTWQFPQGGIQNKESPEQALRREIFEELGTTNFRILRQADSTVSYEFPSKANWKICQKYRGQQHHWFLCVFEEGQGPRLEAAADQDFDAFEFVKPHEAIRRAETWKQTAYEEGLKRLDIL